MLVGCERGGLVGCQEGDQISNGWGGKVCFQTDWLLRVGRAGEKVNRGFEGEGRGTRGRRRVDDPGRGSRV